MNLEEKLAELAVRVGLNLQKGQPVFLSAHVDHLPLVRAIGRAVYRAGGVDLVPFFSDDALLLAKLAEGTPEAAAHAPRWLFEAIGRALKEGTARLHVTGEDPNLLAKAPSERVRTFVQAQAEARKPMLKPISEFRTNWTLTGYPTPAWARAVFPDLPGDEALERLTQAVITATRLDAEDPVAAWTARADALEARAQRLTDWDFDALHFEGPGTDLVVGLAEGHVWKGGWGYAKNGVRCLPNIPTEEVFTMPHKDRVEGVVTATMPFSLNGVLVRGLRVRFKDGVAVEVEAEEGLEAIRALLETDEGARRLGEVALVPADSGVRKAGVLFLNTLFDENAASHIAFGQAYGENLRDFEKLSPEERRRRGMNESLVHQDWMIGSEAMRVTGIHKDGRRQVLMDQGSWTFEV